MGKINWKPSSKEIRIFGMVLFLGFGLISVLLELTGRRSSAFSVFVSAAGTSALVVLLPRIGKFVYLIWMSVGAGIGFVVSRLMLVVVYGLVFTPVALAFRIIGRDALHLRRDSRTTYWENLPETGNKEEHLHLF